MVHGASLSGYDAIDLIIIMVGMVGALLIGAGLITGARRMVSAATGGGLVLALILTGLLFLGIALLARPLGLRAWLTSGMGMGAGPRHGSCADREGGLQECPWMVPVSPAQSTRART